jgi:hypothetical protein
MYLCGRIVTQVSVRCRPSHHRPVRNPERLPVQRFAKPVYIAMNWAPHSADAVSTIFRQNNSTAFTWTARFRFHLRVSGLRSAMNAQKCTGNARTRSVVDLQHCGMPYGWTSIERRVGSTLGFWRICTGYAQSADMGAL